MTILSDFNFSTSTAIDDSFQFVDCTDAMFEELAGSIRAGVVPLNHAKIIISISNQAAMDNCTNVVVPVNQLLNSIINRFGCLQVKIWVTSLLPRPGASVDQVKVIQKQNKGLAKSIRALVQRKQYPFQFITIHKWFLKRVKYPDGKMEVEVDGMYYVPGTIHLNQHGLEHLYLLLAQELQLWEVWYKWSEILIVIRWQGVKRKVLQELVS